jgi:thioredoxin 2
MAPEFEAAARELEPTVRLAKADIERVAAIAAVSAFRGRREIKRQSGAVARAANVALARNGF